MAVRMSGQAEFLRRENDCIHRRQNRDRLPLGERRGLPLPGREAGGAVGCCAGAWFTGAAQQPSVPG